MSAGSEKMEIMTITAAADGSALGNPGPAGWAWYIDDTAWAAGGWPHGTNNQGELMAVLDLFRATAHMPKEHLRVLCDSQYVINCVTKWMPGWKRRGWKKADGKPVLNVDLLKDIDAVIKGRSYEFEWVKGHAGHPLNEAADERARAVAVAFQNGTGAPAGPGFPGGPGTSGSAVLGAASGAAGAGAGPVVRPTAAPVSALNGAPPAVAMTPEPDLFSELEDFASDEAAEGSPEELVVRLEQELLSPAVRADFGRLAVLLHPDFAEIGESGRMWTRDAMISEVQESPELDASLEVFAVERLGEDSILLTYRSIRRDGSALRSSLWLRYGQQWRLRFHQGTPEQG
jgi:ribonuclease HI